MLSLPNKNLKPFIFTYPFQLSSSQNALVYVLEQKFKFKYVKFSYAKFK